MPPPSKVEATNIFDKGFNFILRLTKALFEFTKLDQRLGCFTTLYNKQTYSL